MEIKDLIEKEEYGEYVKSSKLNELIEKVYKAKVIEEWSDDGKIWAEPDDCEPRYVRLRWRVPRRFSISAEDAIKVYGTIALGSEQWAQSYMPEVEWKVKFVKDGEYAKDFDYDSQQMEYQVIFWISYGS
jgi:hypothetical protein